MNRLFELALSIGAAGVVLLLAWNLVEIAVHPGMYP